MVNVFYKGFGVGELRAVRYVCTSISSELVRYWVRDLEKGLAVEGMCSRLNPSEELAVDS